MIACAALTLRAGAQLLLDKLDWRADAGQCWCVIGRNGAGKSTLLRTLAGLRRAEAGAVLLDERPLAAWPPAALARRRAFLAQSRSDAFGYRVIETVLMARHPFHGGRYWEGDDDHRAAEAALRALDLLHLARRDVRSLSGGERQRVAIAALLAQDSALLLLDEPANALDLAHQAGVMRLLAQLCRDQGKTVVMVGHDLNLAQVAASHALLLMPGGSWQAGPFAEVMRPAALGACLGHPIEIVEHGARRLFVSAEC